MATRGASFGTRARGRPGWGAGPMFLPGRPRFPTRGRPGDELSACLVRHRQDLAARDRHTRR
jgi:hypothetical protein